MPPTQRPNRRINNKQVADSVNGLASLFGVLVRILLLSNRRCGAADKSSCTEKVEDSALARKKPEFFFCIGKDIDVPAEMSQVVTNTFLEYTNCYQDWS